MRAALGRGWTEARALDDLKVTGCVEHGGIHFGAIRTADGLICAKAWTDAQKRAAGQVGGEFTSSSPGHVCFGTSTKPLGEAVSISGSTASHSA